MKKIFFVGDFYSNTGPSIVNKKLKNNLGNKFFCYSLVTNKFIRIIELIIKILISKNICFSGFSNINYLGIRLCKLFNKRCFYIMHGYLKKEYEINNTSDDKKLKLENYILNNVNKVICVSESFMNYMKNEGYRTSFAYFYSNVPNSINNKKTIKDKNMIMSTGGLLPIKNNLIICEAIEELNKKRNNDNKIKYVIVGNSNGQYDRIKNYDFVKFYETVPHKKCMELMGNAYLYIQNSIFETFNLSIMESLEKGCNVLMSKNLGITGIFKNIDIDNLIENVNDKKEIEIKIDKILNHPNNESMISNIDFEKCCEKYQIKKLLNIICGKDTEKENEIE